MSNLFSIRTICLILLSSDLILSSSCVNVKKTIYFAGQKDQILPPDSAIRPSVIENHDLLGISVSSLNPQASAVFNTSNVSYTSSATYAAGAIVESSGYLVNDRGDIQFPILGEIRASGFTEDQLRILIVRELQTKKLLVDPIVSVRNLNFKVTVLGEVAHPTVLNVPSEKISLLEALGLAGDITIYGKKDNVMVIRDENGIRTIKRLNLNSDELFSSPYYYLKSNDIVYVEANKVKVAGSSRSTQLLPIILSGLSFIAIIVSYSIR